MRAPLEWLKEFVDFGLKPEGLARSLTMGGLEVESIEQAGRETIFELGITPNRADCLSITGVAREVAAVTSSKFKFLPSKNICGEGKIEEYVKVKLVNPKRCPRYSARVIRGVKIGPSPDFVVKRLAACGVRAINNVVDATNYVMLELGQPLHAFDLRFISGKQIIVQMAKDKTKFTTLDGVLRELSADDLLICDERGPVALAGVMGGENSGINDCTKDILLESAFFEATGVRRTSKRLGLMSESSRRFERGVDPNGTLNALHRLTELIVQTSGGMPTADWVDLYPKKISPLSLVLDPLEVTRILGIDIKTAQIAKILKGLGFDAAKSAGGKLKVKVPTFRPDIERPIDLIEEVARINGYENIKETMPQIRISPLVRPRYALEEGIVRESLLQCGLSEAVLLGFTSEESLKPFAEISKSPVHVANPLSMDQGVMRTTLLPGLLDALKLNSNNQRPDCRLFALQRAFLGSDEPRIVSGVISGLRFPDSWERASEFLDFYDVKGVVETLIFALGLGDMLAFENDNPFAFMHPGSFSHISCSGKRVGFAGQLHPDVAVKWELNQPVFVFEICFEDLAGFSTSKSVKFSEYSRFPYVERDLSILIEDGISVSEVKKTVGDCGDKLVQDVRIFDVYRGNGVTKGQKSLGLKLRFAGGDRTLTDDEVSAVQNKIVSALKTRLGAELRV